MCAQRKKQIALSYIQQVRAVSEERRRRQENWNYQVYPNLYGSTQKVFDRGTPRRGLIGISAFVFAHGLTFHYFYLIFLELEFSY